MAGDSCIKFQGLHQTNSGGGGLAAVRVKLFRGLSDPNTCLLLKYFWFPQHSAAKVILFKRRLKQVEGSNFRHNFQKISPYFNFASINYKIPQTKKNALSYGKYINVLTVFLRIFYKYFAGTRIRKFLLKIGG